MKLPETERLVFSDMTDGRWAEFLKQLTGAHETYLQYGYEESPSLLEAIAHPAPDVSYYSVLLKNNSTVIGYIEIGHSYGNLAFYIYPPYRRQGYAYEAASAIIDAFFEDELGIDSHIGLVAEVLMENEISQALIEKLGFCCEAVCMCQSSLGEDESEHQSLIRTKRYTLSGHS